MNKQLICICGMLGVYFLSFDSAQMRAVLVMFYTGGLLVNKIFLATVAMVMGTQLCAADVQWVHGLRYAATPEAVQLVHAVEQVCVSDDFQEEMTALYREQARQAIGCLVRHLRKALPQRELQHIATTLQDLNEWYAGYCQLVSDKEAIETQAGQEAMLGCQMELMQLLQRPFCAAVLVRFLDIYAQAQMNPESLEGVTKKCGMLFTESLSHLQAELQA